MRDLFINTLFVIINLYKTKLCYLPKKKEWIWVNVHHIYCT